MADFTLAGVLRDATAFLGLNTELGNRSASMMQEAADIQNKSAEQIMQEAELRAAADRVARMGQLETERARKQAALQAGTDISVQGNVLAPMLSQLQQQSQQLLAAQAKVSEIEANSDIINNPFGWLRDLVQGDYARAQRDALAGSVKQLSDQVTTLNAATQHSVATQNAIQTSLTEESINQLAQADAIAAQLKANDAKVKALDMSVNGLTILRQVGDQNFSTLTRGYSLMVDDERWREGYALRKEQLGAYKAARKDKQAERSFYEDQLEKINYYRASVGMAPASIVEVEKSFTSGNYGVELRDQYQRGARLQEQGNVPIGVYGTKPSEFFQLQHRDKFPTAPAHLEAGEKVLQEAMEAAVQEADKLLNVPASEKPAKTLGLMDRKAAELSEKYLKNIQPGQGNPYQAPNISTVAQYDPNILQTAFGQKVLAPLSSAGADVTDPEKISAITAAKIASGEISIKDAVQGYTEFFKKAVNVRNATGGYIERSLKVDTRYMAAIPALQPTFVQRYAPLAALGLGVANPGVPVSFSQHRPETGNFVRAGKEAGVLDHTDPKDVTLLLNVMAVKARTNELLSKETQGE